MMLDKIIVTCAIATVSIALLYLIFIDEIERVKHLGPAVRGAATAAFFGCVVSTLIAVWSTGS
jgi:hypothetical protein